MVLDVAIRFEINLGCLASRVLDIFPSVLIEAEQRCNRYKLLKDSYSASLISEVDQSKINGQ
jgi:hypothetical protein